MRGWRVDEGVKTRGSLKAQLSGLCASLTFLLLQMIKFWQPFWTCIRVKQVNQHSGFRIAEWQTERRESRQRMRRLNKDLVHSYFTVHVWPYFSPLATQSSFQACEPEGRSGSQARAGEGCLAERQWLLPPSGPQLCHNEAVGRLNTHHHASVRSSST